MCFNRFRYCVSWTGACAVLQLSEKKDVFVGVAEQEMTKEGVMSTTTQLSIFMRETKFFF